MCALYPECFNRLSQTLYSHGYYSREEACTFGAKLIKNMAARGDFVIVFELCTVIVISYLKTWPPVAILENVTSLMSCLIPVGLFIMSQKCSECVFPHVLPTGRIFFAITRHYC